MSAAPHEPPEVRHYIGGGYYLLIGEVVELGCDDWPDDEGVLLQHMLPADGREMALKLGRSIWITTPAPALESGARP